MSDTNNMRREFEAWFTLFYDCPPVRDGNAYEGEALGRWIAWQAATKRATAVERERCAVVCETNQVAHSMRGGNTLVNWHVDTPGIHEGMTYAAAIRQGGDT